MSNVGSSNHQDQSGPSTRKELLQVDTLVAYISAHSTDGTLNATLKTFAPKELKEPALASLMPDGQDPLTLLDAERNTLGFLYMLSARLNQNTVPPPANPVIVDFCKRFVPDYARRAPDRVTMLARGILRLADISHNLKGALGPLLDLVTRYPPNASYLTTIHPIFLRACVATKSFAFALPILSSPITMVELTISDLHYNDNLVYHYAGGIAFGALKRWREAEECFEICATAPSQVPAAIQMEALKKLALVQIILYGKTIQPPKYTNMVLLRLFKNTPYTTFLKAYPAKAPALRAIITKDNETYSSDRNLGLINQAIDRAPRWLIKKLTSTYVTLGLSDIGKEVGISEEEVRTTLLSMVESDEINATISANGTVTFSDPIPKFTREDVDRALRLAQEQGQLLQELEQAMNISREYMNRALKHKDDGGWGMDEDMYNNGGGWAEDNIYP